MTNGERGEQGRDAADGGARDAGKVRKDAAALEETVAEVELEETFDRIEEVRGSVLTVEGEVDPEAGVRRVGGGGMGRVVAALTPGPLGRVTLGAIVGLAGISVGIYAGVVRETWVLIVAGVVTPTCLVVAWISYQRWLGKKPYLYRLLTSLGEDAEDLLTEHEQKRVRKQMKRLEKARRRGGWE